MRELVRVGVAYAWELQLLGQRRAPAPEPLTAQKPT
jgi:hypothetical protein